MKKQRAKRPPRIILTILFSLLVFGILVITMVVVGIVTYFLYRAGVLKLQNIAVPLVVVAISSVVVGTFISLFMAKIPVKPINRLIDGMNALASGNFQVRLSADLPGIGKEVEQSFNTMASELQNTELLREDFINNFSHEFKTPLVSIQGFARLLGRGNLSPEKTQEYLRIIASESERLADMATRVLDLTRLENQSILTEVTSYNLSEQLRQCLLLLERKWSGKGLSVSADFDEYEVRGNQEMLQQVWINLLDNAIKFSEPGGLLEVGVRKRGESLYVSVSDQGEMIRKEEKERIFRKFYQADASHSGSGNGIGLAIVHRIVQLHGGKVSVESTAERTRFTVQLPNIQNIQII